MRVYKKESGRLKKVQCVVKSKFPHLGVNKKQEITRLLYEISKKESVSLLAIVRDMDSVGFEKVKDHLLRRRFPRAYQDEPSEKNKEKNFPRAQTPRPYLPKIKLDLSSVFCVKKTRFYPKKIFIERPVWRSILADRFRRSFPDATFSEIKSLKDYLKKNRTSRIADYNKRKDTAFITDENYDFFKACPCTKSAVRCGYNIFNLSFGCIFECTYCYLQEYTNSPGLIFPANIDRFFQVFESYKRPRMRIGTGEFSDSLMLDYITEYSFPIVNFFKKHEKVFFEFKTKSTNINNLLKIDHSGNIVISWSLNPQGIIDENEFLTPSLSQRIASAKRCTEAGYKVAFHFDPVVYFKGWEKEYEKVIDLVFGSIRPKYIAWISIGTLRFNPKVKIIIERRFPGNKILDSELVLGFDNKLRYPYGMRHEIYKSMLEMLFKHSRKLPVYLCMEDASMWRHLKNKFIAFGFMS